MYISRKSACDSCGDYVKETEINNQLFFGKSGSGRFVCGRFLCDTNINILFDW